MKTPEELASLRSEIEALNTRLSELTDEELAVVTGGENSVDGISVNPNVFSGAVGNPRFVPGAPQQEVFDNEAGPDPARFAHGLHSYDGKIDPDTFRDKFRYNPND